MFGSTLLGKSFHFGNEAYFTRNQKKKEKRKTWASFGFAKCATFPTQCRETLLLPYL